MKIPTIIGITLIITLIVTIYLFFINQKPLSIKNVSVTDLQAVNIFDNSATIVWQTDIPVVGEVLFGESENLDLKASDNRDRGIKSPRMIHFVTLNDLKPKTKYFYKIKNDFFLSPEKIMEFTTAREPSDEITFSFLKPLKGTILNTNLNPVDESLIFLTIPNAQMLATFSSTAGNFILPLKEVYTSAGDEIFVIPQDTLSSLSIKKGFLGSEVKVLISDKTVNLPPITLGNNLDLTNYTPVPISVISIGNNTQTEFDFNNDGKINSLDLAILRGQTVSKKVLSLEEKTRFDINSDGEVNQRDIDEFSKFLTR